jgi:hypothetical protein
LFFESLPSPLSSDPTSAELLSALTTAVASFAWFAAILSALAAA